MGLVSYEQELHVVEKQITSVLLILCYNGGLVTWTVELKTYISYVWVSIVLCSAVSRLAAGLLYIVLARTAKKTASSVIIIGADHTENTVRCVCHHHYALPLDNSGSFFTYVTILRTACECVSQSYRTTGRSDVIVQYVPTWKFGQYERLLLVTITY
jgi:hypothetical protein